MSKSNGSHEKTGAPINKARYWWAVLYPENMVEGWQDDLADLVQVPFAYCVHSKDTDAKSEHRKDHVHLIIVFSNTTTRDHAMAVFGQLGAKAVNTCQAIINIRHAYDYLIHDTPTCEKAGKHKYDPSERITGNNFDIGSYEQVGQAEKNEMLREMLDYIRDNQIPDFMTFYIECPHLADAQYFDVFKSYGALIEKACKGVWQRATRAGSGAARSTQVHEKAHEICCPKCGSLAIKKRGKTASDQQRYQCKDCNKNFV